MLAAPVEPSINILVISLQKLDNKYANRYEHGNTDWNFSWTEHLLRSLTKKRLKSPISPPFDMLTRGRICTYLGNLLKAAGPTLIWKLIWMEFNRRLMSEEISYVFDYSLTEKIEIPDPPLSVRIRPLVFDDVSELLVRDCQDLNELECRAIIERLLFLHSKIPTCYVCVTDDNQPILMAWLLTAAENEKLQQYFTGGISRLQDDEVLFEFIYTRRAYRGLRLHSWAQSTFFDMAIQMGMHRAIAYVSQANDVSLSTTLRFGWKPCLKKQVKWRMFRKTVSFESLD